MTVYELIQNLAYSEADKQVYVRAICDVNNLALYIEEGGMNDGYNEIDCIEERMDGIEIVLKPMEL